MTRSGAIFCALLWGFLLSGCIDVEKVVAVKPDGSGSITETVVLTREAIASLKQIGNQLGARPGAGAAVQTSPSDESYQLLDEKKLRAATKSMGKNVTLLSAKKVSTAKGEGYVAIYGFTDIADLKLDQNPLQNMVKVDVGADSTPQGNDAEPTAEEGIEKIHFEFHKGVPARLVVQLPKDAAAPRAVATEKSDDPMNDQMVQQIIKDMRVRIFIKPEGTITETDAQFHNASQVTLMEIDFNKLLANPTKLKAFIKARPRTFEEAKGLVKGINGVKVETKPAITVAFE